MFTIRRKRLLFDDSVDVKTICRPEQQIDPLKPDQPVIKPITDAEGLAKAYAQGATYKHGKTLYVAGSHTATDWFDDSTKLPISMASKAHRYKMSDEALKANPDVTRVVGHSLGGAVALELEKNHPGLQSRTYGAPVFDPLGVGRLEDTIKQLFTCEKSKNERYANVLDPVAALDGSAGRSIFFEPGFSGPHEYDSIAKHHFSDI
jgi:hypothetical protein